MRTKITALILAFVMLFGLTACGGKEEDAVCAHEWVGDSCKKGGICKFCGIRNPNPPAHVSAGVQEMDSMVIGGHRVWEECANCGEAFRDEYESLGPLYRDGLFLFTLDEYIERLNYLSQELWVFENDYTAADGEEFYSFVTAISIGDRKIANVQYFLSNDEDIEEHRDSREIKSIMFYYGAQGDASPDELRDAAVLTLMGLNPDLEPEEAEEIYKSLLEGYLEKLSEDPSAPASGQSFERNDVHGLDYSIGYALGYICFTITVAE